MQLLYRWQCQFRADAYCMSRVRARVLCFFKYYVLHRVHARDLLDSLGGDILHAMRTRDILGLVGQHILHQLHLCILRALERFDTVRLGVRPRQICCKVRSL